MDKIEFLEKNIQYNLYELFAKDIHHARDVEIFTSLANTVKQIIGERWFRTLKNYESNKRTYILSFEYSFGDNLLKNLVKLDILDEVQEIFKKYNIDFNRIKDEDIEFALGFSDMGAFSANLLEEAANNKKNVYSYGLRYRRGMLKQEIVNGEQIEKPDDWKVNKNPWEHEKSFSHKIDFLDYSVKAVPYDIPIVSDDGEHVNTLRIWKSFSLNDLDFKKFSNGDILRSYDEINRANSIVEFLYPSQNTEEGRKLRFTQEYFFARACMMDILKKYQKYQSSDYTELDKYVKIHLQGIHPIFSALVFIDILENKYMVDFDTAVKLAKNIFVFMQLSLLPESFETWNLNLIKKIAPNLLGTIHRLDKYIRDENINNKYKQFPAIIDNGYVHSINIAYYISEKIYVFSDYHKELLKNKNIIKLHEIYEEKIETIELNFKFNEAYKKLLKINMDSLDKVSEIENLKLKIKDRLIKSIDDKDVNINIKSTFIGQLGIFHGYKRQILAALGISLLYYRLKKNPNLDIPERTYIFAGKSYPDYYLAKETIKFINSLKKQINNDLFIKDKIKILFIENYNITKSNIILPALDIYQRLEEFTLEATDFSMYQSIMYGSAIITSECAFRGDDYFEKIKYKFGNINKNCIKNSEEFNVHEFLYSNPEIEELFNFLRNLPKDTFPYNIDNIYNSIYYFNDEYNILKNLIPYVNIVEKAVNDYKNKKEWYIDRKNNSDKLKQISERSIDHFEEI